MPRLPHGAAITLESERRLRESLAADPLLDADRLDDLRRYDFLFPDLQLDDENLLPETRDTRDGLVLLGRTMRDVGTGAEGDSVIPSAYTYFGQFIDHDITLESLSAPLPMLMDPALAPLKVDEIRSRIRNRRTATLDLESVYDPPAVKVGDTMQLSAVTRVHGHRRPFLRPPGKDDYNDVSREGRSSDIEHDRAALIGDPRNDENVIIQQLHVAFLRVHNEFVARGKSFEQARATVRRHYQHIVVYDFLKRICDPNIVDHVLRRNQIYDPVVGPFFLPLEFTVAAYRFGHSMVRPRYDLNLNFNSSLEPGTEPATLDRLFTFTALSGQLGDFPTLPENWIIEWERFVDVGGPINKARRIDTKLVEPLFRLPDLRGMPGRDDDGARLSVRNLLRGYLLRIPTGQAVARALGRQPLTPQEIEAAATCSKQVQALREGKFLDRTPLWYYILAEAAHAQAGRLGPVGSTLVAEVLIGLVRRTEDSIFATPGWSPMPGSNDGEFNLSDLLRFAGVLNAG